MSDSAAHPVLILFAKVPVPGQAKTRLSPPLDAEQAAQVAAQLVEHTVALAVDVWPGPVELHAWPDVGHPFFEQLHREYAIELRIQSPGDLGSKMFSALKAFTDHGQAAAVMGCDVPHCPKRTLSNAYDLLAEQGDNVIGPSTDGGYYLIGLQQTHAALFQDLDWGSEWVFADTLVRARRLGLHFTRLGVVTDIDDFRDLRQAAREIPSLQTWISGLE